MTVNGIAQSALEDGVEDYISTVFYKQVKDITEPLKKNFNNDTAFDEAMQSFIQTLAVGLQMYAMNKVMTFFFDRGASYLASMYSFIIAGKLKKALRNKLKNSRFKGLKAFKTLGKVVDLDKTSERIEIMKIVQSNVDSYDKHKFHHENMNNNIQSRLDNITNSVSNYKGSKDVKTMNLFNDLTSRGAWENTRFHKDIYEKSTGYNLKERGLVWSNVYEELNKYTQYHRTVENKVENLSDSINRLVMAKG